MEESLKVLDQREILGQQFTMYGTIENPLFLAKDIADILSVKNVSQMIKAAEITDDEKGIFLNDTLGGKQNQLYLTEDGLYDVLMFSRKKIAKLFRKEVKAILKQIRLTGGYIPVKTGDDDKTILAKAVAILQRTLDLKETEILKLQPKAELCDTVMQSEGFVSLNTIAKSLNVGRNKMLQFLRDKKVLFKKDRENLAYQKYCDNGCFKINFVVGKNGKLHGVTRVSSKGLKYIYYLYNKSKMSVNMEVAK